MSSLRRFLVGKYGVPDARVTNPDTNHAVKLDAEFTTPGAAPFCRVFASFPDAEGDRYTLTLSYAPTDDRIKDWARLYRAKLSPAGDRAHISIDLHCANVTAVKSLAGRINQLPNRIKDSPNAHCNRALSQACKLTAGALRSFAARLVEYRLLKLGLPAGSQPGHADPGPDDVEHEDEATAAEDLLP